MDLTMTGKEFKPKYSASLVEQITEFLTNAIVEGRLTGGQRLIENELQRQFGISRAPIRESFRLLEGMGLVITIPRKGSFIRKVTRRDVEENFPIMAYLEGLAAREATPHLTSQDIKEMESALSKMRAVAKKNDFKSYLKYHSNFHDLYIYASQNETLIEILRNLRRQSIWFRFSYLYAEEHYEYALRVHRHILDLFIKKDGDSAEPLVREHILIARDNFLQFLALKEDKEKTT
jgi:DNA-binding GntR family transcriptional regulator